ncbi:helix-turn-helix domain-containing protein [Cryobacterium gelidum]|uniref:Helix-turn-helix domain-containing protein n=1 Tax=Cryobacterium gelidum TaxID=1259164 RepID=A0A4R9AZF6_9MICO|nr:helix-turn-helix domain-containing protein [Cryobacterium gelidum]TFD73152.1 helix-turn-helix domain-containing protein [Cryobacterium gelidum]
MRPVHPTPSEDRVRVGARLRASRQAQRLTIEQLASATNLTKGFISRVERDETSPSVATLVTICQVLSLPIGSLFEGAETEVVKLADAPLINMGGRGAVERMITPRGQSHVQVLRSTLQPGADGGDELYTINCDVEVVHVINGKVDVRFSDKTVSLSAGDTLTFSGHELHSWRNMGPSIAEVLWTLVPAAWSGTV